MATYQEQYIYSVQVMGAAQAIAQLQQLQQMTNQVNNVNAGNVNQSGAQAGRAWSSSFTSTVQHALKNMLVYGAIGTGFAAIAGSVIAWKDANVALSDSLAQLQVNLGGSRREAEAYYWQMQQMAFATGQDVSESVYARTIEERINRPGLAKGGTQFGLVFPEVPVQDAVNNLLALQIQFGTSFGEINEVLLDTVQASGLTAKELLNLSDTWGPLSQELGMLDAQGKRSTEGMRNISGLMAGMATVMGESGSTIENFLRKMSQFYTNDDIKAFLGQRGIETTTGKTATGLDIRVPFMDLMSQISAQAKAEPGFAVGLQEFFPNQLGQPTQQQLQELIRNWDTINGIMVAADDVVLEWGNAVETSSQRASVAIERLGVAFSGFFAALGGNEDFVALLNRIAAGVQNTAIRTAGTSSGSELTQNFALDKWANAFEAKITGAVSKAGVNPRAGMMLGEDTRYFRSIFETAQLSKDYDRGNAMKFFEEAIPKFMGSEKFNPKDSEGMMTQAFIEWMNEIGQVIQDQMAQYARPTFTTSGTKDDIAAAEGLSTVALSAVNASYSVGALGIAAAGAAGALNVFSMKRVDIGDATVGQVVGQYERDKLAAKRFAQQYGLDYSIEETPTALYKDGRPVGKINADPNVLKDSTGTVNELIDTEEALAKKNQAAAEAAANKANAQAEARAKRLEQLFDSMFTAITKPTSVTASDLMYNAPGGKYQNKWDEPVRQMRADVNNMIAGKDLEYGFGGGAFSSIFEPGILGFAKGADQDTKASILKDLQSQAETAFYGMTLSPEAYTGSKDALVAEAQKWVEGKKNEKANKSMMKGWLTEAGLGPEAMGFLDEMDEPPILKMLTGGKTKEEMTTLFGEKIPNVSDSLAKGAEDVAWIAIIAGTITAQIKDDPDPLIGAGQVMGGWLAQGSASAFVAALVPQIIAAVLAGLT